MTTIRKGHPRFGAQKGAIVDGWECVGRGFTHHGRAQGYKTNGGPLYPEPCRFCTERGRATGPVFTRWRRVRVKLRWVGKHCLRDKDLCVVHVDEAGMFASFSNRTYLMPVPPHVTTTAQRRRFAERIARAYGYEVERG